MQINNFINPIYNNLEKRIKEGIEDKEKIIRDIREASLYGKIQSYEEIHLMDLLELESAEDIDDGYTGPTINETTGGISTQFEEEETYDMSELDDYEEEKEEDDSGFLGFLKK